MAGHDLKRDAGEVLDRVQITDCQDGKPKISDGMEDYDPLRYSDGKSAY